MATYGMGRPQDEVTFADAWEDVKGVDQKVGNWLSQNQQAAAAQSGIGMAQKPQAPALTHPQKAMQMPSTNARVNPDLSLINPLNQLSGLYQRAMPSVLSTVARMSPFGAMPSLSGAVGGMTQPQAGQPGGIGAAALSGPNTPVGGQLVPQAGPTPGGSPPVDITPANLFSGIDAGIEGLPGEQQMPGGQGYAQPGAVGPTATGIGGAQSMNVPPDMQGGYGQRIYSNVPGGQFMNAVGGGQGTAGQSPAMATQNAQGAPAADRRGGYGSQYQAAQGLSAADRAKLSEHERWQAEDKPGIRAAEQAPQQTSQWRRELDLRNAGVGMDTISRRHESEGARKSREVSNATKQAGIDALNDQYEQEDVMRNRYNLGIAEVGRRGEADRTAAGLEARGLDMGAQESALDRASAETIAGMKPTTREREFYGSYSPGYKDPETGEWTPPKIPYSGFTGQAAQGGQQAAPPRYMVNPQTGERVMLDPKTNKWVPVK